MDLGVRRGAVRQEPFRDMKCALASHKVKISPMISTCLLRSLFTLRRTLQRTTFTMRLHPGLLLGAAFLAHVQCQSFLLERETPVSAPNCSVSTLTLFPISFEIQKLTARIVNLSGDTRSRILWFIHKRDMYLHQRRAYSSSHSLCARSLQYHRGVATSKVLCRKLRSCKRQDAHAGATECQLCSPGFGDMLCSCSNLHQN
jgi:hypothetical protein